jgi:DNA-binding transcriptional regulator YiaG
VIEMKTKIEKNYTYNGLGFPILLDEVEMLLLGTEWCPKVDVKEIANKTIKQLAIKDTPLTGSEVHFIRTHFGMSLRDFADEVVHESHPAVTKWEKFEDEPTKMNTNTEIVIRSFILEQTSSPNEKRSKFYTRTVRAKTFVSKKNDNKTKTLNKIHCA